MTRMRLLGRQDSVVRSTGQRGERNSERAKEAERAREDGPPRRVGRLKGFDEG